MLFNPQDIIMTLLSNQQPQMTTKTHPQHKSKLQDNDIRYHPVADPSSCALLQDYQDVFDNNKVNYGAWNDQSFFFLLLRVLRVFRAIKDAYCML